MHLAESEIKLFYKLWCTLIYWLNQKHQIVENFKMPVYGRQTDEAAVFAVREELWRNPQWIDEFLENNDNGEFTEFERGIFMSWRRGFVKDKFVIMKHYKKYSVFMPMNEKPDRLYGVIGISDSIERYVPDPPPFLVETTLLPFKDNIIYDSFLSTRAISFGRGIREFFNDEFNGIKNSAGIIESIGADGKAVIIPLPEKTRPQKKSVPATEKKTTGSKAFEAKYNEVGGIIEKFCDEKFSADYKEEFKEICLHTLQKLRRKRPSPLEGGKANTWACGIVYAIGSNNFIFDKSQPYFMTANEISEWFGLSKKSAANKSYEVNGILNISYFMPEYCLKKVNRNNPAMWLIEKDGFLMDIRSIMREIQE